MNYKVIAVSIILTLSMFSCKKKEEIKTTENTIEQEIVNEPTEQKVVDPNTKYGKMEFINLEHDFGIINAEKTVETSFTFKNTGDADILISNATGSCGCTVPDYPKTPIAPGETGEIKVSFSPKGKSGMQNKTVTLTANTASGTEQLTVKANIVK